MSGHAVGPPRKTGLAVRRGPAASKKPAPSETGAGPAPAGTSSATSVVNANGCQSKPASPNQTAVERTVKRLRLSKTLTIPEGTTVSDACRRMAARRVDSVLLTDASGILSGIVTDKDIATRVIAEGLRPEQTIVSKIMTRNPQYVTSDALAIKALQKMIQGKFRHLPVVENGEVMAMLDITKCLYDAISRMEKAAQQASAIAAAVEDIEHQWGDNAPAPYALIESLREKMFRPSLSTIITELTKVAMVSPSDPVHVAARRMREFRVNSVIIVSGSKLHGILTSKDILMRVVAQNLSPELTVVEKVMTANPDCATLETTILDALHLMHDAKFLHLPVLDKDDHVVACLDVLQITHAAITMVGGGSGTVNDVTNTMMQKFWDSALALEPANDDTDSQSDHSSSMQPEDTEGGKHMYPLPLSNSFTFKFKDQKGRVHRFTSGLESLAELMSVVVQRLRLDNDKDKIQLLYEDDEHDRVLLATENDLVSAVNSARLAGWKVLWLHIDGLEIQNEGRRATPEVSEVQRNGWSTLHAGILTGTVVVTGIGVLLYLKRSKM